MPNLNDPAHNSNGKAAKDWSQNHRLAPVSLLRGGRCLYHPFLIYSYNAPCL